MISCHQEKKNAASGDSKDICLFFLAGQLTLVTGKAAFRNHKEHYVRYSKIQLNCQIQSWLNQVVKLII